MKKSLLVSGAAVILLLGSFIYIDGWVKYTSAEGKYSISFPAKPTESAENDTTDGHVPFTMHMATYAPSNDEVYLSSFIDMTAFYPKDKTLKQLLEDSRDGAAGSMKATNVITTATNLGKNPYIEFTFTASQLSGKDRIYVIDKFQYSVIYINSASKSMADADKFITSFKHK
jgi:hypothetical protein